MISQIFQFQITVADTKAPGHEHDGPAAIEQPNLPDAGQFIPSPFGFKNQIFHQINPAQIYVNQFLINPFEQPSSANLRDSVEITTKSTSDASIQSIPSTIYSTDFNNRIYPQISTYTNRNPKVFDMLAAPKPVVHGTPIKITANFHAFEAPDEPEEEIDEELLKSSTLPRKHYRIIFIKAPNQFSRNALKIAKAQQALTEEKTVIYVLSKKTDTTEIQDALNSVPRQIHKPEVHFVKYRTNEDAILAQHNIQGKYIPYIIFMILKYNYCFFLYMIIT